MKIMVACDVFDPNPELLAQARESGKAFGAKVYIVTILLGTGHARERLTKEAESAFEQIRKSFEADGVSCETVCLFSGLLPEEELVGFAKEKQVDQIIMGVRTKSKLGKLVFGSTCQHVILHSPCPVLTVP